MSKTANLLPVDRGHVYIHVPFCERKCHYCDFFSISICPSRKASPNQNQLISDYFASLVSEIDSTSEEYIPDDLRISTIYFGGGTPSCVDPMHIKAVLDAICRKFTLSRDVEITLEVNPSSSDSTKLTRYKQMGINRLSIGVQSLDDDVLRTLGRLHDSKLALSTISEAREAGFTNISADLMLGIPGQTLEQLIINGQKLIDSGVSHISMYSLELIEDTKLYDIFASTIEDEISQEKEREMYHGLRDYLSSCGYMPYEISNCAKIGYESRHNLAYWKGAEYFGYGAGSSGYVNGVRYSHVDNIDSYIASPKTSVKIEERMNRNTQMREYAMLSLRTSVGILSEEFQRLFGRGVEEVFAESIKKNKKLGLVTCDAQGVRLTRRGLDLANQVFADFLLD